MDRTVFIMVGFLLPISGIVFTALRRQARPATLLKLLFASLAISSILQMTKPWLASSSPYSAVVLSLRMFFTMGVPTGLMFALWLRRDHRSPSSKS